MDESNVQLTVGDAYAYHLFQKWQEIGEIREEVRLKFLELNKDPASMKEYISKLTSLWGELRPKVEGNEMFGDIKDKFMKFEAHYYDPSLLLEGKVTKESTETNAQLIFELDAVIRSALEKLKITKFEG